MNFETGKSLADFQQGLFEKIQSGQSATPAELSRLEQNYWVRTAEILAPGNLVIRHYCLIDLIKGNNSYFRKILVQINDLSYAAKGNGRIWSESYSYWQYVKPFIDLYSKTFDMSTNFQPIINEINNNFFATAYLRGSVWYPAPFGDLRDVPLDPELQGKIPVLDSCSFGCVSRKVSPSGTSYTIKGWPVGMNGHIQDKDYDIKIINGIPENFMFYTGYDHKYPNNWAQWKDLLNPKRIFSIFR